MSLNSGLSWNQQRLRPERGATFDRAQVALSSSKGEAAER
jgi:hypothetical protein